MWRVCTACGSLVGDVVAHEEWHGTLPTGQQNRLRYGHPRDWDRTPGAPSPDPEPALEPPVSVIDVVKSSEPTP